MNKALAPVLSMLGKTCYLWIFLLSACKSTQPIVQAPIQQLPEQPSDSLIQRLLDQTIDAEWLSAKAKIAFRDDSQSRKASANIRLRKDSVLWMNVKKLGIEAARILITPDSVYLVDRINKEYAISDFSLLQQQYHLPANFNLLQNLILGNPLLLSGVELTTEIDQQQYHLASSDEANPTRDYWLNGWSQLLEKMVFLDYRSNRMVKVALSDHSPLDTYTHFPYSRRLDLSSPETGDLSIEIKLSKVELNVPKTIRFSIPEHYQKIN
ncbi:MAG: DUF4292 domain-containing protein [Bacteroidota bacterium]